MGNAASARSSSKKPDRKKIRKVKSDLPSVMTETTEPEQQQEQAQRQQQARPDYAIVLQVLGYMGSGKRALIEKLGSILRVVHVDPFTSHYEIAPGLLAAFAIDWKFAGMKDAMGEQANPRSPNGFIFVVDSQQDSNLEFQLGGLAEIRSQMERSAKDQNLTLGDIPLLILANKQDLQDGEKYSIEEINRGIWKQNINGLTYRVVSCSAQAFQESNEENTQILLEAFDWLSQKIPSSITQKAREEAEKNNVLA